MMNSHFAHNPAGLVLVLALGLASGCSNDSGRPAPKTYPVTGKVLHADGTPIDAGAVEFVSQGTAPFNATGEIQPDGSFELATLSDTEKLPGAAEGAYHVIVTAGKLEDHGKTPITLPRPYTVEPKPNHFEIRLEK